MSDELNHASIIDGVRLCRAQRFRYRNGDLTDLEARLSESRDARFRVIATDGVFSMDGSLAPLAGICALAERYEALVLVDDSHATGFVGPSGRGTHEQAGVMGRVDVLTGTLGKALGGASGGYASGRREIIEFLRQRSRPYLFSNTVPPAVLAGALKAIELVEREPALRARLWENTRYLPWAHRLAGLHGHAGRPPDHPDHDRRRGPCPSDGGPPARQGALRGWFLLPGGPEREARIRVQMSAALSRRGPGLRPRVPSPTSRPGLAPDRWDDPVSKAERTGRRRSFEAVPYLSEALPGQSVMVRIESPDDDPKRRRDSMAGMTSRERVLAALSHRPPDRVPLDLGGTLQELHHGSGGLRTAQGALQDRSPDEDHRTDDAGGRDGRRGP